ncbi:MAG: aminotransferase class III-fold pyridoxal phosphate-dependent enzyme [bacterium]
MALSRFFGRGRDDSPPPSEPDQPEEADDIVVGDVEPEQSTARTWHERALAVIPGGASTGSKRTTVLYGEAYSDEPTHFSSARGALIADVDGVEYLDCTMALGSVALGYAEPRVTQAVIDAASQGNVSALSSWREVELAERLCAIIPCAERVQFMKSGADATSAAVRLARAYTGRDRVIACGYFGWHDWCSDSPGVPAGVQGNVTRVPFDDVLALEQAASLAGASLAAIVLEPVIERLPSIAWLERARALCDAAGAVLVFDEIKTGFRVAPGGYQEVCGITPDLASFGKALANGYPLAAVVGKQAIVDGARGTWISSTLASESTSLAAALAVLDWHDEVDICATLAETGVEMRAAVERAVVASGIEGVTFGGIDPMWRMYWSDPARESRFVAHAMTQGVLFKRGAYNYAAIAHDEAALRDIETAASAAMVSLLEEESI